MSSLGLLVWECQRAQGVPDVAEPYQECGTGQVVREWLGGLWLTRWCRNSQGVSLNASVTGSAEASNKGGSGCRRSKAPG